LEINRRPKMKVFMLIVVLVALLSPTIVNASCGTCTDSHSCIGESVFQICYDGKMSYLNFEDLKTNG